MNRELIIEDNGNRYWCLDGEFHREGGPAIEWDDGDKKWRRNNELHRESDPAMEWNNSIDVGICVVDYIEKMVLR